MATQFSVTRFSKTRKLAQSKNAEATLRAGVSFSTELVLRLAGKLRFWLANPGSLGHITYIHEDFSKLWAASPMMIFRALALFSLVKTVALRNKCATQTF